MRLTLPQILALTGLVGLGAAFGLSIGQTVLTETDVIERAASDYVQETGGVRTDCAAVPGQFDVWLIVHCGDGAQARTYHFRDDGSRIEMTEPRT